MQNRTSVIINSENVIQFNGIHDSEILNFTLGDDGKSFQIGLRTEEGVSFKIHLSGVLRLICNGFRPQNVVFRMLAYTKNDFRNILKSEQTNLEMTSDDIEKIANKLETGKCILFQIDASVGCEVTCICESIEIEV